MEEAGQSANTIVVFISDNGISMPYAKMNCYQASLRVPLILRWPGKIPAGKRDPQVRRVEVRQAELADEALAFELLQPQQTVEPVRVGICPGMELEQVEEEVA